MEQPPSNAMAEHGLKRFFAEPPGRVDVDCSPSYAQGFSLHELLALESGATEALLSMSLAHYTDDCGRGRLAAAIAALYNNVMPEDVIVLSGVDAVIHDTLASLIEPRMHVVIQSPEYPPLLNVPQWRGATIQSWRPTGDGADAGVGWDLGATVDAEAIVATVPHSPFGWSPDEAWYRALVRSAEERGQLLVVDEDLPWDQSRSQPRRAAQRV